MSSYSIARVLKRFTTDPRWSKAGLKEPYIIGDRFPIEDIIKFYQEVSKCSDVVSAK